MPNITDPNGAVTVRAMGNDWRVTPYVEEDRRPEPDLVFIGTQWMPAIDVLSGLAFDAISLALAELAARCEREAFAQPEVSESSFGEFMAASEA